MITHGNIVFWCWDCRDPIKVDTDSGTCWYRPVPRLQAITDPGIDESDPTATNRWDWIHFNTIQLMDDGSALLSARETSR